MEHFIQSCAFMHDDEDGPQNVDGEYLWRWNEYSNHTFLLGAPVCVVDSLAGYGDAYLDYLHGLGCLPETIIVPQYQKPSLVSNLLADKKAQKTLKEALSQKQLHLSGLHFDREKEHTQLLALLADENHRPQRFPPKAGYTYANDKVNARKIFQQAGLAVPEGVICSDKNDLLDFYRHCQRHNHQIILKQGHWETCLVQNLPDLDRRIDKLTFPLVAERVHPVQSSPIFHCVAWRNQTRQFLTVDQIVENWKHRGNTSPSTYDPNKAWALAEQSLGLLDYLQDFEGVWAVDFILSANSVPLAVDLNPRFNASTYPYYLLQKLGLNFNQRYTQYKKVRVSITNLSHLLQDSNFVPFDPQAQTGILLIGPVFDQEKDLITEFFSLIVGKHRWECEQLEILLQNIVAKHLAFS